MITSDIGDSEGLHIDWLRTTAANPVTTPAPWVLRFQPQYLVMESAAWHYLGQPKSFYTGWEAHSQGLWLVPNVYGHHVMGLTNRGQPQRDLLRAVHLRLGTKDLLAQCRALGFSAPTYLMIPRYYPNAGIYALFVPLNTDAQHELLARPLTPSHTIV